MDKSARAIVVCCLLACLLVRCATLAELAHGDENLPTAGVGPFRKLGGAEVRGVAPYVLDNEPGDFREPAALPLTSGTTTDVALYFVATDASGHDVILRTRSTDGRTFYGATQDFGHHPAQVLAADQGWEGADVAGPSALAVGSEVWMYYASKGSVGLARSSDGLTFTKASAVPVLAADALGPIAGPSVALLPDGRFRMLFAQGDSIYEAASADGVSWQRLDADPTTPAMDPVLAPAPPKATLAPGEIPPFDTLRVADPCLLPRVTAAGRLQIRVLYTGFTAGDAAAPASAIGFAARYGDTGPLVRGPGAVYAVGKHENAPALFEWSLAAPDTSPDGGTPLVGSLLYVGQDQTSQGSSYSALAAGLAPPTATLPLPGAYPDSP
ncbi:MAG TPA: hypothetical protein VLM85_20720 [Polyangiaceae bacterium]|nr:hypothetical protein [Polyangiaceae bacterium]